MRLPQTITATKTVYEDRIDAREGCNYTLQVEECNHFFLLQYKDDAEHTGLTSCYFGKESEVTFEQAVEKIKLVVTRLRDLEAIVPLW
jgi:hypothetical protein